jgi:hypothetical protein
VQPEPDDVDLPDGLVWEELSQDRRWHYKNGEWNTRRSLERRRRQVGGCRSMIADGDPVERVLAEVENCVVLCANCHRMKHHEAGPRPRTAVGQPESDRVL